MAFLAVEFQSSRLPHKMTLKNSVLTTQRLMGLLYFAINSTVARTPELLAIWTINTVRGVRSIVAMKNVSLQEPVKVSVM